MMRLRIGLPRGVAWLLGLLAGVFLTELLLSLIGAFSIYAYLALIPAAVWGGEVWRLLTHTLLSAGFLDLLISGVMIAWLGCRVSRVWSARELLLFCALCAAGAGVLLSLILPGASGALGGPVVLVAGLLVALARLFGHERVRLTARFEIKLFTLVLAIGGAMVLLSIVTGGWIHAITILCGGGFGWLYLSIRWKAIQSQPARATESERIHRLELK